MKLGLGLSINNRIDAEWTPEKFGDDLVMWLRKDTGINESDGSSAEDGDQVTQWTDQSGEGNHMVAANNFFTYDSATGGVESGDGTNSKLYLATDGSKNITFTGGFALYARMALSTISTTGGTDLFVYDSDASGEDYTRIQTSTRIRGKINNSTKFEWDFETPEDDSFNNWGWERDGSNNLYFYLNNDALVRRSGTGLTDGAVSGDLVLDAIGGLFDGIFKEVIWVDRVLTSAERLKLKDYLDAL
ncbi:MAG: hypothetical protein GOVbin3264_47 [Prokaryotic dsDNA virus sp.]|nr:MAG: hypothetical protein GOVbin3264_47 [Prokaryotic dsDNA virus sp.]|tara:strand:+ start:648 stop:1382 length:735 start_codon:yes stop_codon:yes gene_type:complete